MPGLEWDLNLEPDQQVVARRLSFSDSPSASASMSQPLPQRRPLLPSIAESAEEQAAETPQYTAPLSRGISGTLYPSPGETPPPASSPVATWPALAPSAVPSRSQQPQEAVAAARTLEYQRQRQAAPQQEAWAAAARSRSRQLRLYTVGGRPAGYDTKWEELHPVSQRLLLRIESKMREYKYQSKQLDQCSQLHDPSLYNKGFELDASQITQEVGSTFTIMGGEKVSIESLTHVVKEIMWNTDIALRSYLKLRPAHTDFNHRLIMAPTICCYSGAPSCPSPFLQLTVARFEEHLGECCKWIEELEQLVQMKDDKKFPESVESLSKVMSNVHDYFIHVASKVEDIHQYVETMGIQYLNDRRRRGDWNDPFFEADRRESAKQEASVRIVHPTLHLSPPGQPTTPVAAPMMACQLQQTSFPAVATSPSFCPTLPPPSVLPPSSMQTSPASLINPFSSSGPLLQPTPFGSASTFALGSTPSTFSCGTSVPSSTASLFPTPPGGGTTASSFNRVPTRGRKPQRKP